MSTCYPRRPSSEARRSAWSSCTSTPIVSAIGPVVEARRRASHRRADPVVLDLRTVAPPHGFRPMARAVPGGPLPPPLLELASWTAPSQRADPHGSSLGRRLSPSQLASRGGCLALLIDVGTGNRAPRLV